MDKQYRILVAPNEDGLGPSALISHVVMDLLRVYGSRVHITVWNRRKCKFNTSLYTDVRDRVDVVDVDNIILLVKDKDGNVSIPGTLEELRDYRDRSDHYPPVTSPQDFDLVLDFGVPPAARWAKEKRIPSVGVFDHSWSKTLQIIFDHQYEHYAELRPTLDTCTPEWQNLVKEIKADEACTGRMFLFPPFIAPDVFYEHWEHEVGVFVQDMGGVLGGSPRMGRQQARDVLRLKEPGQTILILGGGTPVWDTPLKCIVPEFLEEEQRGVLDRKRLNVAIFIRKDLEQCEAISAIYDPARTRVRPVEFVPNETIQGILPAVDLFITRAGGGAVNDAVACKVPFVCVREKTQSQVEAILSACLERGLTRAIDDEVFQRAPVEVVLAEHRKLQENRQIVTHMREIPCGAERVVTEAIGGILRL